MRAIVCQTLLLVLFCGVLAVAADAPQREKADADAMNVLSYFEGDWDIAIDNAKGKGEKKSSLILGGSYLQQIGALSDDNGKVQAEYLTLMTYDRAQKGYRVWQFLPGGQTMEGTATWDDPTKTLTTIYKGQGPTVTQNFSEPDQERWTWDKASGLNTRRKR